MDIDLERGRLGNVRLRYFENGVMYLSRNTKEAVKYMDSHYVRIPDTMSWRPRCCFDASRSPLELKRYFGKHAYIVGKGKSADKLTAKNFPTKDPIFGINDAFMFLEKQDLSNLIIGVRQDAASGISMPATTATMLIHSNILPIYANYPKTYVFNGKKDFGIKHSCASVIVAIGCAVAMGCKVITLYGFDSYTVGSFDYGIMANHRNKTCDNSGLVRQREQLNYVDTEGVTLRWVTPDLENYLTVL